MAKETFISIDVETLGPVPGLWSMVELGAAVVNDPDQRVFSVCLMPEMPELPGARPCVCDECLTHFIQPGTLEFWKRDNNWALLRQIIDVAISPSEAMQNFRAWIGQFKNPVLVGAPIAFDLQFVHYYWWKYLNCEPPYGHRGLDIKTMAWTIIGGKDYKNCSKSLMAEKFPECFSESLPHTHRALDDAREQAFLFEGLCARATELRSRASKITQVKEIIGQ